MKNEAARRKAIFLASEMMAGTIGVLEGCKQLSSLATDLVPDWALDKDFVVFGGVSSEADDLPTGSDRRYWSTDALRREDKNIEDYEARVRGVVLKACGSVLQRLSAE